MLAGALCLCVAALLVDGTREALGIWYWRDGYVRAELQVLGLSSGGRLSVSAWLNLSARNLAFGDLRALSAAGELPGPASVARRGLALAAFVPLGAGPMRTALRRLSAA